MVGYERHQRAANLSPGTIRLHRYRLLDLAAMHSRPERISTDQLNAIIGNPAWMPETRRSVRSCYRAFFKWAVKVGHLEHNPAEDTPTVKIGRRLPHPTPEHVLADALRLATKREELMIRLGAYAGLRVAEIARVHRDHWDGLWLTVIGKGDKERRVPITEPRLRALLDRLNGWAFPNVWCQPMTPGHVSKLVSSALPGHWTGHSLRHRFGTVTVNRTKDIQAAAEVLGHEQLETTRLYALVAEERLLAIADAAA